MRKRKRPLTHFERVNALVPMLVDARKRALLIDRPEWIRFTRHEFACSTHWAGEAFDLALENADDEMRARRRS